MSKLQRVAAGAFCIALVLVLAACKVPGAERVSDAASPIMTAFVTNYSGDFTYDLDVGSDPRDVYFVFSNKTVSQASGSATVESVAGPIAVNGKTIAYSSAQPAGGPSAASSKAKDMLARSNRDIVSMLQSGTIKASGSAAPKVAGPSFDTVGVGGNLNDLNAADNLAAVAATCRYVSAAPVATSQGNRTLNIWVANACWDGVGVQGAGAYPQQRHLVNIGMVNALASKFLSDGSTDIYALVTNILGAEWGAPRGQYASQLISPNAEITILLSDIEQDNSDTGGVVGYFWAGNNFLSPYASGSNQRIMFVIDATMFANPAATNVAGLGNAGWNATTSFWAEECFSTLAHEFQHMIQFYQKGVVARGDCDSADTWINEMCSQLIEDLVANDMLVKGPRGVAYNDPTAGAAGNGNGRIPYFNQYLSANDRQLTKTGNYDALDYSFSYAFGSWLLREYGGADFVKRVVLSSPTNEDAVTGAVKAYSGQSLSLGDLVQRWSVAVLGSGSTSMPVGYRYNTGAWVNSYSAGHLYQLGSINFFNYTPAPQIIAGGTGSTSAIQASSNVYYLAKAGMTKDDSWKLSMPEGVAFSVYVTP